MQIYVKTLTGATLALVVEESTSVASVKQQIAEQTGMNEEEMVLMHGLNTLQAENELSVYGIEDENTISLTMKLMGGKKKKRKKKIFTKPKRVAHKHKARPKAVLDYYTVDENGKVNCVKKQSPKCKAATYMAEHQDRFVCGQTGTTYFKLTADGKRLPVPKQASVKKAETKKEPVKAAKKGKKK
eukprot:NODE_4801_length_626_cov_81.062392_g4132_i0.p2 GENE.NODE_4801_length_626_cov_81.062392_g4132_i0~~NODE_4801_length_626_cov_81.062392_g4132_i0.p2  ORF type:complete len:185 (-),score=56.35 NODE_4801_length_626_cov_81.062392_g4132_i0:27-581(-)